MKERESVKEFRDKLMTIVNKMKHLSEELTDNRIVEKLLMSLPKRFESNISSLEDFKGFILDFLDRACSCFSSTRKSRLTKQEDNTEEALLAK